PFSQRCRHLYFQPRRQQWQPGSCPFPRSGRDRPNTEEEHSSSLKYSGYFYLFGLSVYFGPLDPCCSLLRRSLSVLICFVCLCNQQTLNGMRA
ncbi:hypothetical protein LINPERHAP1_LOCUS1204, partial [Linum perenne]